MIKNILLLIAVCYSFSCAKIIYPKKAALQTGAWIEKEFTATGYCYCQKCTGWTENPAGFAEFKRGRNKGLLKRVGITASGYHVHPGTVAADTRLLPFGSRVLVPGYGYGTVRDRGGDIKGNHIDLYFPSHEIALHWGRKKMKIRIHIPKKEMKDGK